MSAKFSAWLSDVILLQSEHLINLVLVSKVAKVIFPHSHPSIEDDKLFCQFLYQQSFFPTKRLCHIYDKSFQFSPA